MRATVVSLYQGFIQREANRISFETQNRCGSLLLVIVHYISRQCVIFHPPTGATFSLVKCSQQLNVSNMLNVSYNVTWFKDKGQLEYQVNRMTCFVMFEFVNSTPGVQFEFYVKIIVLLNGNSPDFAHQSLICS